MEKNSSLSDNQEGLKSALLGRADLLVPPWVKKSIEANRDRIQDPSDLSDVKRKEVLRIKEKLDYLRSEKSRCIQLDEEQFNSGIFMPAGMCPTKFKILKGTGCSDRKSPNFFNFVAELIGFN